MSVGAPRDTAEHYSSLSVNQLTFLPPPTIYLSGDPRRDATKSADLRGRRREAKKEGREDERKADCEILDRGSVPGMLGLGRGGTLCQS